MIRAAAEGGGDLIDIWDWSGG